MVVSHFFSPLRTLKKKAARKASGSQSSVGDVGSSGSDDNSSSNTDKRPSAHENSNSNGSSSAKKDNDAEAKSLVSGLCLCCNRRVTYPASVSCFKCTVCDTINDLQATKRMEKVVGGDGSVASRARMPPPPLTLERLRAGIHAFRRHPEKQVLLEAMLRESFGNWDVLNVSFPASADDAAGIAIDEVRAAYQLVLALPAPCIRAMMGGIEQLLRRPGRPLRQKSDVRFLLIVLENPLLMQQTFAHEASYHHRIAKSAVGILANLPPHVHYALVLWSSQHGRSALRRRIALVNQFISYRVQKYDRARRRNQAQHALRTAASNNPLTAYSSRSNQTELPAFQRTRSVTNAQPPLPPSASSGAAGLVMAADRATKHARMRSNTDSRVSLSSRERSTIFADHSSTQHQHQPPPTHLSGTNAATAALSNDGSSVGLGISTRPGQEYPHGVQPTQQSSRHLGSDHQRRNHRAPGNGVSARNVTAPGHMHLRSAARCVGSGGTEDGEHSRIATRQAMPGLCAHTVLSSKSSPTLKATVIQPRPLFNDIDTDADSDADIGTNTTAFIPLATPVLDSSAQPHLPLNPSPSSFSPSAASENPASKPHDDAVRLPRTSVLGVLDGTAEPRSPSVNGKSGPRGSLTRTRSSSEAPARRRNRTNNLAAAASAAMAHDAVSSSGPIQSSAHGASDWGSGVDLDDYYVGADGVFYPKTSALVMYQHDWRLVAAAKVMALLHAANLLLPSKARLPVDAFYNKTIESMDLVADYDAWQTRTPGAFSFCQYPFLLSLAVKVQIMQVDAARQMNSKLKEAVISALFETYRPSRMAGDPSSQPHLKLLVRRHCLVEDSLHQLATREQDLKKRLKIEFVGEEGIDAGGLTKEWFMLLVRELLNPMYGMFTREDYSSSGGGGGGGLDDDDALATGGGSDDVSWAAAYWFNPASLEASNQYFLVGVVVGLALYNSNILDLQLPLAVFKKLMRTSFYQTHQSLSAATASFTAQSVSPVLSAARPVDVVAKGTGASASSASGGGASSLSASSGSAVLAASATTALGAAGLSAGAGGGGSTTSSDGRSPIYGLLSPSAQLRYQINEMLSDVSQFRPQLARGLRQLLLYRDDDVEDVFCLTFEASYDALGQVVTVPLVPNGANIPVTSQNRVEYVMRYLQWVLNDSVSRQFEPFRRGFYYVCGGNALSLFKPEEIELMVHGSGDDWNPEDLRAITEYVNFAAPHNPTAPDASQSLRDRLVCWFWEILTDFTAEDRRMFLSFVTGADRMPTIAAGSTRLRMKLALLGDDFNRLPIARTCFNQLGIWLYRSKEELKAKLVLAIRESSGFGLQ
ncbi:putative E3 ubiquitin-protein ligase [Coemansia sp. RSA 1939]|nr:putative E3 ubiquitin-protein ligase [Coemansia sp. RSA 1939]